MAVQKYFGGTPFYRQQSLQQLFGMPVSASTVFDQCEAWADAMQPLFIYLQVIAAKAWLYMIDLVNPNLNPIERLWKVMNEYARNNQYFATAKEFQRKINHFLDHTLPQVGASLISRINDNFQVLSPAS